ncbi:zinc finger protein 600-like [Neocloeon triangulifer]|uniref:zinc finger protein 600-like n=1 Tax=Neocloeon triangulifer TaxID=2078957 RepID=UPI00286F6FAF|nr:zinc finger protein 600-like [Neocloeon triangulifer]
MWPGKPLCRLCERPAADGGFSAAELDKEKFAEWCLNFLGETLADELADNDLVCCFCVWDARFLLENTADEIGHLGQLCWWPREESKMTNAGKPLFDAFRDGRIKQCWVPLEKLPKAVEEKEEDNPENVESVKCIYCKNSYTDLVTHTKRAHQDIAIRCDFTRVCTEYFFSTKARDVHVKKFHVSSKDFSCIFCLNRYSAKRFLNVHVRNKHPNKYNIRCRIRLCKKFFNSQADLESHFKLMHSALESKKIFGCQMCSYRAMRKTNILYHTKYWHKKTEQPKQCRFCLKYFDTALKLQSHVNRLHNIVSCPFCERKLSTIVLSRHATERLCKICGTSFSCSDLLQKHKSGCKKDFYCHFCSKVYFTKHKLKYHINCCHLCPIEKKSQFQSLGFECKICCKYFSSKGNLKNHTRLHSTLKFECNHCCRKFSSKYVLIKHLSQVHNLIEKKHKCAHCDKKFYKRSNMKSHSNRHLKSKVQCSICKSLLKNSFCLPRHMIKMHCIRI